MPSSPAPSCIRRSMCSRSGGGKLSGDSSGLQGAVLTASWELDLWGRVRYGRAAAAADAASAAADFEYARQSIAALVAKSWFLATEAGLQAEVARATIRDSEELVRLAETARASASATTKTSTSRARTLGTYRGRAAPDRARRASRRSARSRSWSGAIRRGADRGRAAAAAAARRGAGRAAVRAARAPARRHRRRAPRRRRVQPRRRGEGGPAAGDLAHRPASARSRASCSCSRITTIRSGTSAPTCWRRSTRAARSRRRSRSGPPSRSRRSPPTRRSACARSARSRTRWRPRSRRANASRSSTQTLADNQRALEIVQTQFKVGSTDLRFVTQRQLALNCDAVGAHPGAGRAARPARQPAPGARRQLRVTHAGAAVPPDPHRSQRSRRSHAVDRELPQGGSGLVAHDLRDLDAAVAVVVDRPRRPRRP